MKLVRYGKPGKEKPGLIDANGKLRDLSGKIDDLTPEQLSDKALAKLAKLNPEKLPLVKGDVYKRQVEQAFRDRRQPGTAGKTLGECRHFIAMIEQAIGNGFQWIAIHEGLRKIGDAAIGIE